VADSAASFQPVKAVMRIGRRSRDGIVWMERAPIDHKFTI